MSKYVKVLYIHLKQLYSSGSPDTAKQFRETRYQYHTPREAALGRIAAEDQGFGWETAAAQVARPEADC